MSEYTLGDVKEGDNVRAFHPHTFGVVHGGTVTKVGRTYVHVRFGVDINRTHKIHPRYITQVGG